jgi:putative nucleotidyltransferase with HDIG domain
MGGNVVLAFLAKAAPRTARLLLTSETDFSTVASLAAPFSVDAFVPKRDASTLLLRTLDTLFAGRDAGREAGESEEEVEHARELARSIARALAMRDVETEAHCVRVAALARRLAMALGLSNERLLDTELGALLHDVGKIGVRDAVLLKREPLTPSEWEEMRRHPDLGAAFLREIPALRRGLAVVQNHHERFDGSGYPRGLVGAAIPLEARIFQIADAYDAIRSDRPYRKGRSDSEARAEILRHVGSQFDPQVHDAFARIDPEDWSTTATVRR